MQVKSEEARLHTIVYKIIDNRQVPCPLLVET